MINHKIQIARKLRNNPTDAEKKLWYFLRSYRILGIKFRRQQPIGRYVVDFVCLPKKLIIELDGSQHLNSKSDEVRDDWLNKEGFTVLRFWNNEVLQNIEGVMEKILNYCNKL
ncbi:MAG: endonuclease domain-containing protein [Patescibacteria group bacterium]